MAYDDSNVFARILRGELPCARDYQDADTLAFMDAGQVNPGHVIVATTHRCVTILDLTDDQAAALFRTAARVARAVEAAFAPAGITILQANRPAGWQSVPHVHLHVLPRHEGGSQCPWRVGRHPLPPHPTPPSGGGVPAA